MQVDHLTLCVGQLQPLFVVERIALVDGQPISAGHQTGRLDALHPQRLPVQADAGIGPVGLYGQVGIKRLQHVALLKTGGVCQFDGIVQGLVERRLNTASMPAQWQVKGKGSVQKRMDNGIYIDDGMFGHCRNQRPLLLLTELFLQTFSMEIGMIVLFLFQHAVGHLPGQLPVDGMLDDEEAGTMGQRQGDHSFSFGRGYRCIFHEKLETLLVSKKVEQSLPFVCRKRRLLQERPLVASEILDAHPLRHHGKAVMHHRIMIHPYLMRTVSEIIPCKHTENNGITDAALRFSSRDIGIIPV